jgi:hypothetical protein
MSPRAKKQSHRLYLPVCYGLGGPGVESPIKYRCVTTCLLSKLTPYSTEP